jgi:hypothetical protein
VKTIQSQDGTTAKPTKPTAGGLRLLRGGRKGGETARIA